MSRLRPWVPVAALLLALGAGCRSEPPPAADEVGDDPGAVDGLSREQIREQAEAMSPEQAAELGIVDTTIHIEKLTSPSDSALLSDTLRAGAPDTTP